MLGTTRWYGLSRRRMAGVTGAGSIAPEAGPAQRGRRGRIRAQDGRLKGMGTISIEALTGYSSAEYVWPEA